MNITYTPFRSARLLLLLLMLALFGTGLTAKAAIIPVTNGNDAGADSLRQAIETAADFDVIEFTGVSTVTLPNPDVTITATPSATLVCTQTSLTLSVPFFTSVYYAFSGPGIASTTGNTAVVNKAGVYSVTVTDFNGQTASSQITVYASNTGTPAVRTINRKSPAKELSRAAPVTYEVTFSDNVTGVDASDFTLTKTGTLTGGTVGAVSGSGSTY